MPKFIDLTNRRFGRMTVVARDRSRDKTFWRCRCDCGIEKTVRADALLQGKTLSCGCFHKECVAAAAAKHNVRHGHKRNGISTRTYCCWQNMMRRCYNPKDKAFFRYGGRGISVCPKWHFFENFLADMGVAPEKMELERIDFDGNYEPSNCTWATHKQQMNNMSRNRVIKFEGTALTLQQWADTLGIQQRSLDYRLKRWPLARALTQRSP